MLSGMKDWGGGRGGAYVACSDATSIITHFIDVCAFSPFVCGRSCAPKCFGTVCVDAFGGAAPASCPRQQNYTKREGTRDEELFLCLDTGQHSRRAEREVQLLSCQSHYSLSSKPREAEFSQLSKNVVIKSFSYQNQNILRT